MSSEYSWLGVDWFDPITGPSLLLCYYQSTLIYMNMYKMCNNSDNIEYINMMDEVFEYQRTC